MRYEKFRNSTRFTHVNSLSGKPVSPPFTSASGVTDTWSRGSRCSLEISFRLRLLVRHLGPAALTIFIMQKITDASTSCFSKKKEKDERKKKTPIMHGSRLERNVEFCSCLSCTVYAFYQLTDDFGKAGSRALCK